MPLSCMFYLMTQSSASVSIISRPAPYVSQRMNRRVLIIVSLLGISAFLIYKVSSPKILAQEGENRIKMALFKPKSTQVLPKIEFIPIPKKGEKYKNIIGKTKLQPVEDGDWSILNEMPTYQHPDTVLQSDWWRAAAFLEIDLKKRPKDLNCKKQTSVGNWLLCEDEPYNVQKPCLVYSFGIGFDFSFDDAMAKRGCEVHSFDPSMNKPKHVRQTGVVFHPIGLSTKVVKDFNPRHDIYVKKDQSWTMMDLLSIMEMLGHKDRVLDYLKIDIEGHEWSVVDYLVKTGITSRIRQFTLEYHIFTDWPAKAGYPDLLRSYKRLKEAGFYKYFTNVHQLHHNLKNFRIQADVCYVNTKFQTKQAIIA